MDSLQLDPVHQLFPFGFCRFLNSSECTFSTQPLKNDGSEFALGYYHMQNVSVPVNDAFIHYLKHYPLVLEVFGHYQQHPLHGASSEDVLPTLEPAAPIRMPQTPIPQSAIPVRSSKTSVFDAAGSTHTVTTVDLMTHFEILELSPTGEYLPAAVNHTNVSLTSGCFLLQQGIQRRISLSILYESGSGIKWNKVNELVVGRVRPTLQISTESEHQSNVLSLNLFKPKYDEMDSGERYMRTCVHTYMRTYNIRIINRYTIATSQVQMNVCTCFEVW